MKGWKFHYPELFWEEENKFIKRMSPYEFNEYLNSLRRANDIESSAKFKEIIRKMIERGSCFEGTLFLRSEEVKAFLENERLWVLDERREPLWKEFANLHPSYPLKKMRDGFLPRNAKHL